MKNFSRLTLASLLTAFLMPVAAFSIEIPLTGATGGSAGPGGGKIGYVDMDKIFRVFPQTKNAKEDYAKQLDRKRKQIAEKEIDLQSIENKISVLEATLKGMSNAEKPAVPQDGPSTEAPNEASNLSPQSLVDMKADLELKKIEYEDLKKRAAEDLAAFESQQSQMILGKIYQALRDLAQDEQVTLVVDKSTILYGTPDVDLTEKLQVRVRGY